MVVGPMSAVKLENEANGVPFRETNWHRPLLMWATARKPSYFKFKYPVRVVQWPDSELEGLGSDVYPVETVAADWVKIGRRCEVIFSPHQKNK